MRPLISSLAMAVLLPLAGCATTPPPAPPPVALKPPPPQVEIHVRERGSREARLARERAAQERDRLAREVALERSERERAEAQAQRDAESAKRELEQRQGALDEAARDLALREADLAREKSARDESDRRAREALEQVASVKQEARGWVVTLNGSVLFGFDDSSLLPDARRRLDVVANVLKQSPEQRFRIEGYTDSVGSDAYNLELSQRRAESVRGYLIAQGIDPLQLSAAGYGENGAIADNRSAEGRANNRRVEIVLPKGLTGTGGSGPASDAQ